MFKSFIRTHTPSFTVFLIHSHCFCHQCGRFVRVAQFAGVMPGLSDFRHFTFFDHHRSGRLFVLFSRLFLFLLPCGGFQIHRCLLTPLPCNPCPVPAAQQMSNAFARKQLCPGTIGNLLFSYNFTIQQMNGWCCCNQNNQNNQNTCLIKTQVIIKTIQIHM